MNIFNLFNLTILFSLLLTLVGCDLKTDTQQVINTDTQQVINTDKQNNTDTQQVINTDKQNNTDNVIFLQGLKTQTFKCLNEEFNIDHISIINNSIETYITNISTESIYKVFIDDIELRPIKNGKPVKVRSNNTVMYYDQKNNKSVEFNYPYELYPGETAVIKQTMQSNITNCDDYAIFRECYNGKNFDKLSNLVNCSNLK